IGAGAYRAGVSPPRPYLRFPTLAGNTLCFGADDDVWAAPLEGGAAKRLTADRAPVRNLRLSPDATALAYTGRRDGAPEAYVIELEGGEARRLTYFGDDFTRVIGWSPTGEVLVVSAARQPFRSRTWAY